jgi:hypothetical protein
LPGSSSHCSPLRKRCSVVVDGVEIAVLQQILALCCRFERWCCRTTGSADCIQQPHAEVLLACSITIRRSFSPDQLGLGAQINSHTAPPHAASKGYVGGAFCNGKGLSKCELLQLATTTKLFKYPRESGLHPRLTVTRNGSPNWKSLLHERATTGSKPHTELLCHRQQPR